jgi:CheY-like chemotaxis protein
MHDVEMPWRSFAVLIASDSDLWLRSLESALKGNGYDVARATEGSDAIRLALAENPHALILDDQTRGMPGLEICRRLLADPQFDLATPMILTTGHVYGRAARLDAYRAGFWDICPHPVDGEILLIKLNTFIRAREAARHPS